MLDNYHATVNAVTDYIGLINIYFAPTACGDDIRKHLEGCLGWNLRRNHPGMKIFYPDDNHVGTKAVWLGQKLIVNLPEEIAGIDQEQEI